MTCEAGVVLQIAQARARDVDRLFRCRSARKEAAPSAAISRQRRRHGGAGLRRGARDGVGLEVVLADGRILNSLSKLKKGQHRLRSAQSLHRRRGHARHHHGCDLKTVSKTARDRDRLCRPEIAGAGAEAAVDLAERGGRQPDQF